MVDLEKKRIEQFIAEQKLKEEFQMKEEEEAIRKAANEEEKARLRALRAVRREEERRNFESKLAYEK